MKNKNILIVDDEIGIRSLLSDILQDEGYTVLTAENAQEARQIREKIQPAVVLLDIWMPDCDGITLLKEWANNHQLTMPVIMMSGHAGEETATEASKIGAVDFLEKPIALKKLLTSVERAISSHRQQTSKPTLNKLGSSPAVKECNQHIVAALNNTRPVLLIGEMGVPFQEVASYFSKNKVFIEPNETDITEQPIETLNKATGGVLFLGDLQQYPKNLRPHLLFLLDKASKYQVRVVCTSAQSLLLMQAEGFDADGKFTAAFAGNEILIPPLRKQSEDIAFFVEKYRKNAVCTFSDKAIEMLQSYSWQGNHAQLHAIVQQLTTHSGDKTISDSEVRQILYPQQSASQAHEQLPEHLLASDALDFNLPLRELREELERRYFHYHIAQEDHNMSRVAEKVGLERTHLYRKLKQLGINTSKRKD